MCNTWPLLFVLRDILWVFYEIEALPLKGDIMAEKQYRYQYRTDEEMLQHKVRFYLSQHFTEEELCNALHLRPERVRELVYQEAVRSGKITLV